MKTWLKRTLVGTLGAVLVFGGIAACSHRHHAHGWHAMSDEDAARMKARLIEKAGSRLDLDAAQKARLGTLADKLREQRNALIAGSAGSADPRAELRGLVAGASFDRAKAKALIAEKTGALNSKGPEVVDAAADFYDSLKPEQQSKLRELMAERRGGWRRG